ncbi:4729_t:CDS:1 [Paraglomus occultum]|uniref:4729_t:CDS:1 n=1 Tax=Paraglomus occultum TaxID=144539 RepID=A0A9N9GMR7_9GLOM|nr:4729_t:CDS:1 [Paraglomus occultum]
MAQPPKPLSKDYANYETSQITAAYPMTGVPVNSGYVYTSSVSSSKPTQPVAVYPTHPQVTSNHVYASSVSSNKPTQPVAVYSTQPVAAYPTQPVSAYPTQPQVPVVPPAYNNVNPNIRGAVNPTPRPPYVIVTRRDGCGCNWEVSVTVVAVLLMLVGSIMLGVGLSNCAYVCYVEDYDLYVAGAALLAIGIVTAICILVAFLARRSRAPTTTVHSIQPTMQSFQHY